jgi:hypothetical protein
MYSKVRRTWKTTVENTYGFYKTLLQKTGHLLFSRFSLIVTGLIILSISVDVLCHLYEWALTPSDDLDEMLRETEGISTLFLGIGLILKERRLLEKIFGSESSHEDWINNISLHTGLGLILTGTAIRIAAQLIRIPNRVISTQGKEHYIFAIGLFFGALASLQLIYLIIKLGLRNHYVKTLVTQPAAHALQTLKRRGPQ